VASRPHRILRVTGGRVAYTNTAATITDAELESALRYLARHVDVGRVVVHAKNVTKRSRTWGYAYKEIPAIANLDGLRPSEWDYLVVVRGHRHWRETLAHELKHVEQYRHDLPGGERIPTTWAAWICAQWPDAQRAHDLTERDVAVMQQFLWG
jgi:hypothetical protein